eukprot:m.339464 g.339464  ORF g.339464 m.339464 type:complete len:166 (-) comp16542_c1_seq29:2818-3315(-)
MTDRCAFPWHGCQPFSHSSFEGDTRANSISGSSTHTHSRPYCSLLCPKRAWTPSPLNRAVLILHSSPGNQGCCWRNNTSFASKGADVTVAQSENGPKPVAFLKRWKQPFQPDGEEQQWLRDAPLNVQKQKAASLEASSGVNLVLKPEDGKPKVIQGHEMWVRVLG